MDKQTEAMMYAYVLCITDKMAAGGIRDLSKKYMEHMNRGDYVEAVQYLEQIACIVNVPAPAPAPPACAPLHPSMQELARVAGCQMYATVHVIADAARKRIIVLEDENKAYAYISGALPNKMHREHPRNKYDREILPKVHVDVYDVLNAFKVWSPEVAHAVKKLLAPGQRGDKSLLQDLKEAQASIEAAVRREEQKN